ncbi:luc7 amine-terminal protein (macronuclear) [Tetrahymena thermophila SB210]|uniref:Luc7 amine-terminal protein n=1 Tax=Tetrahymena thermophila (strain SB210) TaxID=312017 RepID=I7MGW4_TETTS|nr:luc7 amine-terminal protein [Tetrahymena thermophila SB210]EAS02103.3 luc7 amine-terminal protein [Tetrahymena thermophila SB210]|eukprot:XP_001022348.3 luc7 amine-terminal protein [Tetrahymena thermophila SB210]
MDQQKLLLDQFFGVDRNLSKNERNKKKEHYSDKEVCIFYLVSQDICYKDIFPNTPYDDGPCKSRHDEFFKRQFQDDSEEKRAEFEYTITKQVIDYIQKKIDDIDHKVQKNKQFSEKKNTSDIERPKEIQDKIDSYEALIKQKIELSKELGDQGEIEQAEKLSDEAEQYRIQRDLLINSHDNNPSNSGLAQKEVCDICGAWKITNDKDKRAQTHLEGKIHQGFQLLRDELIRLKNKKESLKQLLKRLDKEKEKKKRSSKSKSKDRKREKDRDRERDRSSGKSRRDRSRDRSGSSRKNKKRSSSRGKDKKGGRR